MRFKFVEESKHLHKEEHRPAAIVWLTLQANDAQQNQKAIQATSFLKLDCVKIIQEHGGLVRLRDDGLTAVFGIPTALEDDVIRAVITAHKLNQTIQQSPTNDCKIAVSYNHVTIRHNQNGGKEILVEGDALDQAERLIAVTPLNKIWVTGAVQSATNYYCQYQAVTTEGLTAVSVWEFLNVRLTPDQPRGLAGRQTSFIGRDAYLQAMLDLTKNLDRGEGGIIWIEGEAGIGKSRLMREFIATMTPEKAYIWSGGCSPKYINQAFSLFNSLMVNAFNLKSTDDSDEISRKIESRFREWPKGLQNIQGYLEILAGIQPSGENSEKLNQLQPEQLRQQTFVATRRLLKTLIKDKPIIILCDDLHWIDPVSAELLQFIATMAATDPVFFVCAQRRQGADAPNERLVKLQSLLPGFTHRIFLNKLTYQECLQLVAELLPDSELPENFIQLTISRSVGNPYFIEEFIRMFIEQGHLYQENGRWQINYHDAQLDELIPVSLDTLIHARVDALPDDLKQTLQRASIIGAKFDAQLLHIFGDPEEIPDQLERLRLRLMVSKTAVADIWEFNHILFHTVVYNTMPIHTRQSLHLKVAISLQNKFTKGHEEGAKELAYHFSQAERFEEAIPYLILAGELAAKQYANEEAVQYFQQAKKHLTEQTNADLLNQWRIAIGLGVAFRNMGQYDESISSLEVIVPIAQSEPEFNQNYPDLLRHLGETCRKKGDFEKAEFFLNRAKNELGEPSNQILAQMATQILTELAWVYFSQGQYELARKICDESLIYARKASSLNEEAKAENLYGGICYRSGDWQGALIHTTRAMVYREQIGSTWDVAKTYDNLGILAFAIGHWSKAIDYLQRNLALRLELGDVEGIAITHNNLAEAYNGQGKFLLAETHYRESVKTARLYNILYHIAHSSLGLAQVLTKQNKYQEAKNIIADILIKTKVQDNPGTMAELMKVQAELHLAQNELYEALDVAQRAAKLASECGFRVIEAESWRVSSEAALKLQKLPLAQSFLDNAKAVLDNTTDQLEKGLLSIQSYQINKAIGNKEAAQADLETATNIFTHLGAEYQLENLKQLLSQD